MDKNLTRMSFFNNIPVSKHNDSVRDFFREAHFMGHNDHCHSFTCKILHYLKNFTHELRVQGGSWLIKEHHFWLHSQRSCDCYPLFLPPGQLFWIVVGFIL